MAFATRRLAAIRRVAARTLLQQSGDEVLLSRCKSSGILAGLSCRSAPPRTLCNNWSAVIKGIVRTHNSNSLSWPALCSAARRVRVPFEFFRNSTVGASSASGEPCLHGASEGDAIRIRLIAPPRRVVGDKQSPTHTHTFKAVPLGMQPPLRVRTRGDKPAHQAPPESATPCRLRQAPARAPPPPALNLVRPLPPPDAGCNGGQERPWQAQHGMPMRIQVHHTGYDHLRVCTRQDETPTTQALRCRQALMLRAGLKDRPLVHLSCNCECSAIQHLQGSVGLASMLRRTQGA